MTIAEVVADIVSIYGPDPTWRAIRVYVKRMKKEEEEKDGLHDTLFRAHQDSKNESSKIHRQIYLEQAQEAYEVHHD